MPTRSIIRPLYRYIYGLYIRAIFRSSSLLDFRSFHSRGKKENWSNFDFEFYALFKHYINDSYERNESFRVKGSCVEGKCI